MCVFQQVRRRFVAGRSSMAGSRDAIGEEWRMRLRRTGTGPGICQYVACFRLLARPYIVNVQALSIHADDNFMSLSFLQATVAEYGRSVNSAILCIQWLWQRGNCVWRLHCGCAWSKVLASSSSSLQPPKKSPAPVSASAQSCPGFSGSAGTSRPARSLTNSSPVQFN